MKSYIHILGALAVATSLTCAQDEGQKPKGPKGPKRPNPEEMFKKLDTNSDDSISLDEFKAGPMAQRNPDKAEEVFKKLDKDSSGGLSLEEFKKGRPPRPPGGGRGPGKGGEGDGDGPPPPPPGE